MLDEVPGVGVDELGGEHVPEAARKVGDDDGNDEETKDLVAVHDCVLNHNALLLRVVFKQRLQQLVEAVNVDEFHEPGQPEHPEHFRDQNVVVEQRAEGKDCHEVDQKRTAEDVALGDLAHLLHVLVCVRVLVLHKKVGGNFDAEENFHEDLEHLDFFVPRIFKCNIVDRREARVRHQQIYPHIERSLVLRVFLYNKIFSPVYFFRLIFIVFVFARLFLRLFLREVVVFFTLHPSDSKNYSLLLHLSRVFKLFRVKEVVISFIEA